MVAYHLRITFCFLVLLGWGQAQPLKPSQQFLDVAGYRQLLVQQVDVWNGGLDGQSGMLYAEILRLTEAYPEKLEALSDE